MRNPRVSVCIPTFNRAALLQASIRSVLGQRFGDFELIVSDNASSDDTERVAKSFSDDRLVYARNPSNLGIRANWNRCLELARGEFVAVLPDDDLMQPENLAEKVAVLNRDGDVGLVHSKYDLIDGEGKVVQRDTNWGHGPDRYSDAIDGPDITLIPMYNMLNTPTVVFRKACYERLGGFADGAGFAFDYEYWMRIAVYNKVAFSAKPLIHWRIHAGAATSVHLGKNDVQKLRQVISAKRLLLAKHAHAIPASVRKQMYEQMRSVTLDCVDQLLEQGGAESEARSLLREMQRADSGFLWHRAVWKAWLKSVLTRENIDRLKRVSSFQHENR